MERKTVNLKLQVKMPCPEIRKRTKITDIIENTLKLKWGCAAQSGNQGEGRNQGDDHAEDGKTT